MAKTMYVSPDGSNTSPYDTWAKAALQIQTCRAAVDSGGGNIIYVAPGSYSTALTNAAYDGTSGSYNKIIACPLGTEQDGGGNTSGRTGWVRVTGTADRYDGIYGALSLYTAEKFWQYQGIWFDPHYTSYNTNWHAVTTYAGVDGNIWDDCLFGGEDNIGLNDIVMIDNYTVAAQINRCRFQARTACFLGVLENSMPASPAMLVKSCSFFAHSSSTYEGAVSIYGAGATSQAYLDFDGCYFHNRVSGGYGINGYSSTYAKFNVTRSVFDCQYNYNSILTLANTVSDNYRHNTNSQTGITAVTTTPLVLLPVVYKDSPITDVLADFSGSLSGEGLYDQFGQSRTQTPGPNEYIAGKKIFGPPRYSTRGVVGMGDLVASGGGGLLAHNGLNGGANG